MTHLLDGEHGVQQQTEVAHEVVGHRPEVAGRQRHDDDDASGRHTTVVLVAVAAVPAALCRRATCSRHAHMYVTLVHATSTVPLEVSRLRLVHVHVPRTWNR